MSEQYKYILYDIGNGEDRLTNLELVEAELNGIGYNRGYKFDIKEHNSRYRFVISFPDGTYTLIEHNNFFVDDKRPIPKPKTQSPLRKIIRERINNLPLEERLKLKLYSGLLVNLGLAFQELDENGEDVKDDTRDLALYIAEKASTLAAKEAVKLIQSEKQ